MRRSTLTVKVKHMPRTWARELLNSSVPGTAVIYAFFAHQHSIKKRNQGAADGRSALRRGFQLGFAAPGMRENRRYLP